MLVNTREARPWEQAVNQTIATVAHTTMVDLYGISAGTPQYFELDGVHLDPRGRQFCAPLLVNALDGKSSG